MYVGAGAITKLFVQEPLPCYPLVVLTKGAMQCTGSFHAPAPTHRVHWRHLAPPLTTAFEAVFGFV